MVTLLGMIYGPDRPFRSPQRPVSSNRSFYLDPLMGSSARSNFWVETDRSF